jgi:hypothetical protein
VACEAEVCRASGSPVQNELNLASTNLFDFRRASHPNYNLLRGESMERKIFWIVFVLLGLLADFLLPIWWGLFATIPIVFVAWWVAYRSDWF